MSNLNCNSFRTEIIEHFRNGQAPLSAEAKAHFADCEICIAEVTKLLDQASQSRSGIAQDASNLPSEAQQALAHGRQVLQREFGISVASEGGREAS